MNKNLVKSVKVIMLLFFVVVATADGNYKNIRRGGSSIGLLPFPRVGRNDPTFMDTYGDVQEVKRQQGLIPFPRVGRNDLKTSVGLAPWLFGDGYSFQKRNTGGNVNGGMWFGPRLGRLQKRSFEDGENPWAYMTLKDPLFRQNYFLPKLAESEEDNDDTVIEVLSRTMDTKNRNISQQ